MAEVMAGPIALQLWLNWLTLTAGLAIVWALKQRVARAVLLAFLLNVVLMMWAYGHVGMERLLGGVHFVFMAPAVYYAWKQLPTLPKGQWHTKWVRVFGATWVVSLWIDAVDVVRWFVSEDGAGLL